MAVLSTVSYYFYNLNFRGEVDQIPESETETINTVPVEPEEEEETQPSPLAHMIQIEVLNGCGVNGIAKIFQERFMS